jgi:hypothetical protein
LKNKQNKKFDPKKEKIKKIIFSICAPRSFLLNNGDNGGKYLKKDFFVRKNMKRKFLEILFFISELGGKTSFSRETGKFSPKLRRKVHSVKLTRKTKEIFFSPKILDE